MKIPSLKLGRTDPKTSIQLRQATLDNISKTRRQNFVANITEDTINFEARIDELETQYLQLGGSKYVLEALTQGENALLLGGEYALVGKQQDWRVINHDGRLVEAASGYKVIEIQGQQICIIRSKTGNDYSAATLPGTTNALFVGERYFNVLRNQYEGEVKKGYKANESLRIINSHELTHIRFHNLGEKERREATEFFAQNWGNIYSFAQTLLSREDYRTHILKFSQKALRENPNEKTRPITVNNETYNVAVEAVIDELLAYYSGIELLGETRMRELVDINPTGEHPSRELLSVRALECIDTATRSDKGKDFFHEFTSILYSNLGNVTDTFIAETKRFMLQ